MKLYTDQVALPHIFCKDNEFLRLKLMDWDTKNLNIHINYAFIFLWHLQGNTSEKNVYCCQMETQTLKRNSEMLLQL